MILTRGLRISALAGLLAAAATVRGQELGSVQRADTQRARGTALRDPQARAEFISRIERFERELTARALESELPFANPPTIRSGNGVLQATLAVDYSYGRIGDDAVKLRSFNGSLVGPTLRVRPGDSIRLKLINDLPDEPVGADHPADINTPHGFNTTNLHTHGLHVSPTDNSDNVFLQIPPGGRQDFRFDLDGKHPPGTHWYHPHKHGSVGIQVSSGMAGALIIEGGLDEIPAIAAAQERVFVLQQIPYSDDGTVEDFERIKEWADLSDRVTTINGLKQPVIDMAPEEVQRWRFIDAGIAESLELTIKSADESKAIKFQQIAADGIALGKMVEVAVCELSPGNRWDVLVKAPEQEGDYLLVDLRATEERSLREGTIESEKALARIRVCGTPRPMPFPDAAQLAPLAPYKEIKTFDRERKLTFKGSGSVWTINGEQFEPSKTSHCPVVGTAEQWTLVSDAEHHPFHIHVNPFHVLSIKNPSGTEILKEPIWKDTILLRDSHSIIFRTRFEQFDGKTVLHCHKLDHEDQGMMQAIHILPVCDDQESPAARSEGPSVRIGDLAPAWRLPDADGTPHELAALNDRPLILLFYRGMGCLHCVKQLSDFASRRDRLEAAGVRLVAIGSDSQAELKIALDAYTQQAEFPFLILADEQHEVFKRYECLNDGPLHGVFLIDRGGQIRWRKVTESPLMEIERIIELASELRD